MVYIDCEENVFRFFVFKSHTYKTIPDYRTKEPAMTSIEFPNNIIRMSFVPSSKSVLYGIFSLDYNNELILLNEKIPLYSKYFFLRDFSISRNVSKSPSYNSNIVRYRFSLKLNPYRFLEIEFKEKYPSAKLLRNLFQIFSKNFVY
ncbi:MAG: hypothetical protein QW350_04115 [Candidatus Aenigmatarchaeota archaeon]